MDEYLGMIRLFAGNFVPEGWLLCDGQSLTIADNEALYSVLGNTYGGDGHTKFNLPNFNGKMAIGMGKGAELSARSLGEIGGSETAVLLSTNMPAHTHSVPALESDGVVQIRISDGTANSAEGSNRGIAQAAAKVEEYNSAPKIYDNQANFKGNKILCSNTINISKLIVKESTTLPEGDSVPFSVMQPSLGLQFIICKVGLYPQNN